MIGDTSAAQLAAAAARDRPGEARPVLSNALGSCLDSSFGGAC